MLKENFFRVFLTQTKVFIHCQAQHQFSQCWHRPEALAGIQVNLGWKGQVRDFHHPGAISPPRFPSTAPHTSPTGTICAKSLISNAGHRKRNGSRRLQTADGKQGHGSAKNSQEQPRKTRSRANLLPAPFFARGAKHLIGDGINAGLCLRCNYPSPPADAALCTTTPSLNSIDDPALLSCFSKESRD